MGERGSEIKNIDAPLEEAEVDRLLEAVELLKTQIEPLPTDSSEIDSSFNVVYIPEALDMQKKPLTKQDLGPSGLEPVGILPDSRAGRIPGALRVALTAIPHSEVRRVKPGKVVFRVDNTRGFPVDFILEHGKIVERRLIPEYVKNQIRKFCLDTESTSGMKLIMDGEEMPFKPTKRRGLKEMLEALGTVTITNVPPRKMVFGVRNKRKDHVDITFVEGQVRSVEKSDDQAARNEAPPTDTEYGLGTLQEMLGGRKVDEVSIEEKLNLFLEPLEKDHSRDATYIVHLDGKPIGTIANTSISDRRILTNHVLPDIADRIEIHLVPRGKNIFGVVNRTAIPRSYKTVFDGARIKVIEIPLTKAETISELSKDLDPATSSDEDFVVEIDGQVIGAIPSDRKGSVPRIAALLKNLPMDVTVHNIPPGKMILGHRHGKPTKKITWTFRHGKLIKTIDEDRETHEEIIHTEDQSEKSKEQADIQVYTSADFVRIKGQSPANLSGRESERTPSDLDNFRLRFLSRAARNPDLWEDPDFVAEFFTYYEQLPDAIIHRIGVRHILALMEDKILDTYPHRILSIEPSLHGEAAAYKELKELFDQQGIQEPEFTSVGSSAEILDSGLVALQARFEERAENMTITTGIGHFDTLRDDVGGAMRYDMIESGALNKIIPVDRKNLDVKKLYTSLHNMDQILDENGVLRLSVHGTIPEHIRTFLEVHGYDIITEPRTVLNLTDEEAARIKATEGEDGLKRRKNQLSGNEYLVGIKRARYTKKDTDSVRLQTFPVMDDDFENADSNINAIIITDENLNIHVKLPDDFYNLTSVNQEYILGSLKQIGATLAA